MGELLRGKTAVITGGGSGIGAAISRAFAAEGAAVAVTDRDLKLAGRVAGEIREAGGNAAPWKMDVLNQPEIERTADEIEEKLGSISIWVNNAGVSIISPFIETSEQTWDLTLNVNLKGTFLGCQAACRKMITRQSGVIINMSSQSGKSGNSHYAAYCASKFGIIGLTQSLAVEFAGDGIRVNALCPGVIFTPMWESQVADYARKRDIKPEEVRPYMEVKIPMKRLGTPEDVAQAALFLAGNGSSYITGQAINISGGSIMH